MVLGVRLSMRTNDLKSLLQVSSNKQPVETRNCLERNSHDLSVCHFKPSMSRTSMVYWYPEIAVWHRVSGGINGVCILQKLSRSDDVMCWSFSMCSLHDLLLLFTTAAANGWLLLLLYTYWKRETFIRGELSDLTMVSLRGNSRTEFETWILYFKSSAIFTHQ